MIRQKSLDTWLTLECSVKDCPNKPELALQVNRKAPLWRVLDAREIVPATREDIEKGLLNAVAFFTPCPSDEGAVREYLVGRGYTPDMIEVIQKETIERYAREEAERESRRAGKERR